MDQQWIDIVGLGRVGHHLGDVGGGDFALRCDHRDRNRHQSTGAAIGPHDQFPGGGCFGVQRSQRHQRERKTQNGYFVPANHCYYLLMEHMGFVLAGGRSTRMGRDKALLPLAGKTLLEQVAGVVLEAVDNVTVIGPPERYGHLGLRVIPDLVPDCGPLGGLLTALTASTAERVLLVACDMPELTPALLRDLMAVDGDVVVCETEGRLHPLCAVYHRSLLAAVETAVRQRSLKMHDFLSTIQVRRWPVSDVRLLANLNTPEDLLAREAS